ncbi:MAG: class I SAM-dependent methyltransferase, partial [Eubacterium sp.]|nr:class I SAM-dependent methyltransferase [Eubacterium sp.]
MNDIAKHYDLLIEENNDPVHDPEPLRIYMDKWDGQKFIDNLELNKNKTVLEIGVGTGRLAIKT